MLLLRSLWAPSIRLCPINRPNRRDQPNPSRVSDDVLSENLMAYPANGAHFPFRQGPSIERAVTFVSEHRDIVSHFNQAHFNQGS
jgi:hypothetical protein